ncbi:LANO_0H01684g1_1 [Lachancea nothofagi CBS 11611]|uniref:LANO_0H01684g1_1 n=1 Tax=Lachancea nothofagi CBS 11611 TaxID=1266666 RepID=A0A1G4KKT0_9SACH|nr:LANO_0H01684g1_1 [Lachancea nothofagi CBS 11611]
MSAVDVGSHAILPPDEEELLLSRLVFGDTADFHANLSQIKFLGDELANEEEIDMIEADSEAGEEDDGEEANIDRMNDDQLFFVDDGAANEQSDQMAVDASDSDNDSGEIASEDESSDNAWSDSDDDRVDVAVTTTNRTKKLRTSYTEGRIKGRDYVLRLRAQFEKIYPRPTWADALSGSEELDAHGSDSDNEGEHEQVINGDLNALSRILQNTYTYQDTSNRLLPPKTLDITRLKDANAVHPSRAAVQSLSFHPLKPLLLTGGYDRTLRIYHIDGKTNHLVTSLYLTGTPVQTCSFYVTPSHEEQKIFTGGRRRYMHSWDISSTSANQQTKIEKISRMYGHEDTQRSFENFKMGHLCNKDGQSHGIILLQGNNGWVNVLHATTGVWITGCKIEGVLVDFCLDYRPVSKIKFQTILIMVNTYGEIWEFDLAKQGEVLRRWKDEGSVGVTTIQVGGGNNSAQLLPYKKIRQNRWLAIGSSSGYVHVYDRNSSGSEPIAKLDQLTTPISSLAFSPDGQILCMASRAAKDALRLVHLPSGKVFSNWPTSGTPLGKVTSVAFSPRGEMIAAGNEQGKVRLWRLNHYV